MLARAVKAELPDWIVLCAEKIPLNYVIEDENKGTPWLAAITEAA